MVVDLERAIAGAESLEIRELGGADLARALAQALGTGGPARLVAQTRIKAGVFRLRFEVGPRVRSLIVKRMPPEYARRNELVIRRWLPELGLAGLTPELLGLAASSDGGSVWHVYDDLGPWELDPEADDPDRVSAVVRTVAAIHSRFAEHPVLAEVRLHGMDFGPAFLASNVRDAIHALERLGPSQLMSRVEHAALRDRLLGRLHRLRDEESMRTRALADWGGSETLLHGDLWTTNTFAEPAAGGVRVRLIDWDRAGVGSASYDLSTFLLRFPAERRSWLLSLYRETLAADGWRMPGRRELNLIFETAEYARYANRVIWPALALLRDGAAWGWDELAAVEGWFEALEPVLQEEPA
jgi:hypothetical protein